MNESIFEAFQQWINQPHKLDRRDYGFDANGRRAWWSDYRTIQQQKTRARKALRAAKQQPFNETAMRAALRDAYSARLEWKEEPHTFVNHLCTCCSAAQSLDLQDHDITLTTCPATGHFEYCTGQYFPTEFAAAAAAVLERYFDAVRPKFTPTADQQNQWWSIDDIERASYNAGSHWFDKSAKRFFRSRILSEVYQGPCGIFFVSSEKGPSGVRRFTIRQFDPKTADIDSLGPFNQLTRERAQRLARIAADHITAAKEALGITDESKNA